MTDLWIIFHIKAAGSAQERSKGRMANLVRKTDYVHAGTTIGFMWHALLNLVVECKSESESETDKILTYENMNWNIIRS